MGHNVGQSATRVGARGRTVDRDLQEMLKRGAFERRAREQKHRK